MRADFPVVGNSEVEKRHYLSAAEVGRNTRSTVPQTRSDGAGLTGSHLIGDLLRQSSARDGDHRLAPSVGSKRRATEREAEFDASLFVSHTSPNYFIILKTKHLAPPPVTSPACAAPPRDMVRTNEDTRKVHRGVPPIGFAR
jgi:hypothetical protein